MHNMSESILNLTDAGIIDMHRFGSELMLACYDMFTGKSESDMFAYGPEAFLLYHELLRCDQHCLEK